MPAYRLRLRRAGVALVWASTAFLLVAAESLSPFVPVSGDALQVVVSATTVLAMTTAGTVGAVVVLRQPGNAIGRLLLVMAPTWALALLSSAAVKHLLVTGNPLPAQEALTWLESWVAFVPFNLLLPVLLLLFPTGRLLSRRWRPALWLVTVGASLGAVGGAFAPGGLVDYPSVDKPLGIGGAAGQALTTAWGGSWLFFAAGTVFALSGLVARLRRADTIERQQVKWLMYAAGLCVGIAPAWMLSPDTAGPAMTMLAFTAVPVAIGIAVLRYRLYDIDRVISRTLSYSLLTGLLVGVYLSVVTLLTTVLPLSSGVAVAAATLIAAAMFEPARRRLQGRIDRRFNRERYDGERLVEGFANRMRDPVDFDRVHRDLLGTTVSALQPATVSVWFAGESERSAASWTP